MSMPRRYRVAVIKNDIQDLADRLLGVASDQQEAFENLPESLQTSPQAESMEDLAYAIYDAHGDLDNVLGILADIARPAE